MQGTPPLFGLDGINMHVHVHIRGSLTPKDIVANLENMAMTGVYMYIHTYMYTVRRSYTCSSHFHGWCIRNQSLHDRQDGRGSPLSHWDPV